MNSNILNAMGLGGLDIGIVLIVLSMLVLILAVLLVITMRKLGLLTKKYNFFMKGRAAKSLEAEISEMFAENRTMREDIDRAASDIEAIYGVLKTVYRKTGLVKYDAFNQMGGRLSFCLALLDEEDNGFLLNSVHGNDSSYSYIKRIEGGQSRQELSGEEEAALKKATGEDE